MKTFPTIVAGIFIGLGLVALLIFSTFSSKPTAGIGRVVVWGPYPESQMEFVIGVLQEVDQTYDSVSYQYVPKDTIVDTLISAIASGKSPDLVMLNVADMYKERDKILTIPYSSVSRRSFQDSFIEAAEVLLFADGLKGLPFTADPLVMYWNRSLFAGAGVAQPPEQWDELALIAPKLTKTNEGGTLITGAVSLGTWDNVTHAKPVLISLMRQLGNAVMVPGEKGYASILNQRTGAVSAADSALRFYTEFADPIKPVYSWNRSQPDARSAFVAGKVAIYFGRASEAGLIREANPNLNFDIARLPSIRGGGSEVETELIALSIPRGARNSDGALLVAEALSGQSVQADIQSSFRTPSVRRDSLAQSPSDPYLVIFRNSALASFTFRDPDPVATEGIFRKMIESVTSGAMTVSEAVSNAAGELSAISGVE